MVETPLRKKAINSFLAGIVGSAVADTHKKMDEGMRYQCMVLQAWFESGRLPDGEDMAGFILRNMNRAGLSLQAATAILGRITPGSIFPMEAPWDALLGWTCAFMPDEIHSGGRLAAAAVAAALQSRSSLQDVISACMGACARHGIEGMVLHERLAAALLLANECSSLPEFKKGFEEKFLVPVPNSLIEVIPLALACVVLGGGKPFASIQAAVEMGRNTGQTAALAGQIAGALNAVEDFPPGTVENIIKENPEINIRRISKQLGDLVINEYNRALSTGRLVFDLYKKEIPPEKFVTENANLLFDKYLGFLIGGACGDAMGCPVEWLHYEDIRAQFGWVDRFLEFIPQKHNPHRFYESPTLFGPITNYDTTVINSLGAWDLSKGTYSDDMRFRLLLCSAMLEKENVVAGSEFADYLLRYRLQEVTGEQLGIPSWKGPQREWSEQLTSGVMLEALYGKRQPVGFCVTWDGPAGLLHPADEELASRHGYLMAACIAHAFKPDATVDSVVECACKYAFLYGEIGRELPDRILGAVELARKSKTVYQFFREFHDRYLVPQPSWQIFILEQIPATMALLTFGEKDPKQAILSAVNFGRDTDTIACMVGELAGTLFGASAIPREWTNTILAANPKPDLLVFASRLTDLALKRAGKLTGGPQA
jgi:ADP-ribosylglycohydrolase